MLEQKNLSNALRDVDSKSRIITGYLSAFDVEDLHGDVVHKGAFARSIKERGGRLFFLNQHDWSRPLSKFSVLEEDDKGLYFETQPLPDTSYAKDVISLYASGILNQHSIGYYADKSDVDKKGIRHLREVQLIEGSVVTEGANRDTPFTGFKSLTPKSIREQIAKITKALRNGTLTDQTCTLLEVALQELHHKSYLLGVDSLESTQPGAAEGKAPGSAAIITDYLQTL